MQLVELGPMNVAVGGAGGVGLDSGSVDMMQSALFTVMDMDQIVIQEVGSKV